MIMARTDPIEMVVEPQADPAELARSQARRQRFEQNCRWFQSNVDEISRQHRGKHICVSGEELFAGESVTEVLAQAKRAHPEDDGRFVHYIPRQKMYRIYPCS